MYGHEVCGIMLHGKPKQFCNAGDTSNCSLFSCNRRQMDIGSGLLNVVRPAMTSSVTKLQ